jgi:hypothetical protein
VVASSSSSRTRGWPAPWSVVTPAGRWGLASGQAVPLDVQLPRRGVEEDAPGDARRSDRGGKERREHGAPELVVARSNRCVRSASSSCSARRVPASSPPLPAGDRARPDGVDPVRRRTAAGTGVFAAQRAVSYCHNMRSQFSDGEVLRYRTGDWWRGVTVSAHAVLGRRSGGHVRERSNLHRA